MPRTASLLTPGSLRRPGLTAALLVAGVVAGLSCRDSFPTAPTEVDRVMLTPRSPVLTVGDSMQLSAVALDVNFTGIDGKTAAWSSASAQVASIDARGMLRAIGEGTSVVTATIDGHTDTTLVTVLPTPVDSIDVTQAAITVTAGLTGQLTAVTYDDDGNVLTGREILWSSANAGVATVNEQTGLVTGTAPGMTWVRATSNGRSDSAQVTVIPVPVRQVVVSPKPAQVQQGSTLQLSAETRDSVGGVLTGRAVSWTSRNVGVASVSASTGLVSANATGQAYVVATSEGVSDSSLVTVAVPSIVLSTTSVAFTGRWSRSNPAAQAVSVTNGGPFTLSGLSATIAYGAGSSAWLSASLGGTTAPTSLTLQVMLGSLSPGTYTAAVTVSSSQPGVASRTVNVSFTVEPQAIIGFSNDAPQFASQANGVVPPAQQVTVSNAGTGTLGGLSAVVNYGAGASGWLSIGLSSTTAPSTLTLQPSTTALAVGTYTAFVIVTSSTDASVAPDTVRVTYVLAQGPIIGLSRTTVAPSAQAFSTTPDTETVSITNAGQGTLDGLSASVTYASAQTGWLTATVSPTTAPSTLTLVASASGLAAGTYGATVTVSSSATGVESQAVTVSFTVGQQPVITLTPDARAFAATRGGALPASQTVSITNSGGGTLSGLSTATSYVTGSGWLDASLGGTTAPATLTLTPNTTSLVAGTYSARVVVSSTVPGVAPDTVTVTYTVHQPQISLSATAVALGGRTRGDVIASSGIGVSNGGQGTLSGLSASSSASWVTPSLSSTTAPSTLTLAYNTSALVAGTYNATVTVSSSLPGVTPQAVSVSVTVLQPQIGLGSTSITRSTRPASTGASVTANTVSVSNTGDAGSSLGGLSASDDASWLTVSLNTTTAPATLTITYDISGLAIGAHSATITVASSQPGVSPRTIAVTLNVQWSFASDIRPMLVSCDGCHDQTFTWSNLVNAASTTGTACDGRIRVVPNNTTSSVLYRKLTESPLCGSRMPPTSNPSFYWTAEQIQKIADWINNGAPNN